MAVRLYVTPLSNPSHAAIGMLEHKQLPHKLVKLPSGLHPYLVRAARFSGRTVPALRLEDGRRIQSTLGISRVLDELIPERPLFPIDPAGRRAVEEAERWGHDELQPVPRRIFRRGAALDGGLRRWIAADVVELPAPAIGAAISKPIASLRSRESGGDDLVRADVARLPALLDHADALVANAVIGTDQPNAADFQILASVRVLLDFKALPSSEERPSARAARRLFPVYEGEMPWFPIAGTG
jgi:glutathione S-transferase